MKKRCRVIAAAVAAGVMLMAQPAQAAGGWCCIPHPCLWLAAGTYRGREARGAALHPAHRLRHRAGQVPRRRKVPG